MTSRGAHFGAVLGSAAVLLLSACTAPASRVTPAERAPELSTLRRADVSWLERVTFGLDSQAVGDYRRLGREHYLEQQLRPPPEELPAPIAAQVKLLENSDVDAAATLKSLHERRMALNALPEGEEKEQTRKALNDEGNRLAYQAIRLQLLRAIYSPAQLREQMVWFWLNHFSVYQYKNDLRWLVGDYEERAIRPYALGRFRDLVLASLEHPAMLQYLDNSQNAVGHVNENYARELMELHALGVGSGYTQQDVQQLALILTGVGIAPVDGKPQHFNPKMTALVVRKGLFEFNPQRHDFSDKMLLGHAIRGRGFDEVRQAVDIIVQQPACAQFVSRQLAEYFVADNPPPALLARMTSTFRHSDGDIASVMRTMFESPELLASSGKKFKDPNQFVVSSVRLAYSDRPIANALPLVYWLNQLDEPLFGRITPDGWPLDGASWSSSGQMEKRFDIANAIGTGNNQLFTPAGSTARGAGFPMLSTRLYYDAIEPQLSAVTRTALSKAISQQEWNTYLLSSPDLNYR